MNSKVYKSCGVPLCGSSSIKNPNKLFVHVPNKKKMRYKWFNLAQRNPESVDLKSHIYFCEDHFDLPNDMDNYMEYHIMGFVAHVRMKPGCIPTKFQCQEILSGTTADTQIMSTKSSPTKKDDKSPSASAKKDDKTPAILTRHQSAYLNTRQLRKKDQSRKKISEITQMLLSPTRERSKPQLNKKKSPKEKKIKDKTSPKKKFIENVPKLVLDVKKDTKAKKRKIVTKPKGVKPAKLPRSASPSSVSMQELIDICEEQSLNDEDLLEILTCESPVWWEMPPTELYSEEAIAMSPEKKRYFQEIFKSEKNAEKTVSDTSNIKIPEVKQNDQKFMKKRSKLENLLGNIKNKLTDSNKDSTDSNKEENKNTEDKIDETNDTPKKSQEIESTGVKKIQDIEKRIEQKVIKQEVEVEKGIIEQTPSEGTSSSEEMFYGFQNEEILKDLENMNIPIEDMIIKEEFKIDESNPHQLKNVNSNDVTTEDNNQTKDTKSNNNLKTEYNTEDTESKTGKNNKSILESRLLSKPTKSCEEAINSVQKPKNTISSDNTAITSTKDDNKQINKISKDTGSTKSAKKKSTSKNNASETLKPFNSVNIYYIDATTPRNNDKINTNVSSNKKEESNDKCNDKCTKNNEKETSSSSDSVLKSNHEVNIASDSNTKDNEANKSIKNNEDTNKDVTKEDNSTKSNISKNLNKDRLMAVYKIITDDEYRQNLIKTIKNEVAKPDTTNILNSTKNLDTILDDCKIKTGTVENSKPDFVENQNKVILTEQKNKNSNETNVKGKISNDVIPNVSNDKTNNEILENTNKINSKETTSNKISRTNSNEDTINEEGVNINTIESKDSKNDKSCTNCDMNTETSLNITSKVKSAKYCLKCSSIFESETCSYCAQKSKMFQENCQNTTRKGNS